MPTIDTPPPTPRPAVVITPLGPAARDAGVFLDADAGTARDLDTKGDPVAWTYEDARGVTQIVQSLSQVPQQYRARARPIR